MHLPRQIETRINSSQVSRFAKEKELETYFQHPLIHKQIHGEKTYVALDVQRLGFYEGN